MCGSFKVCVLEVRRLDKFAAEKLLIWRLAPCWRVRTLIPERVLLVFPFPPSLIVLRRALTLCVRSVFWYSELAPVPESIRAVAARCRARACASRNGVRPVVVLRGEGVSAHAQAREACVQKNGGVEEMSSASAQLTRNPRGTRQAWCSKSQIAMFSMRRFGSQVFPQFLEHCQ